MLQRNNKIKITYIPSTCNEKMSVLAPVHKPVYYAEVVGTMYYKFGTTKTSEISRPTEVKTDYKIL